MCHVVISQKDLYSNFTDQKTWAAWNLQKNYFASKNYEATGKMSKYYPEKSKQRCHALLCEFLSDQREIMQFHTLECSPVSDSSY